MTELQDYADRLTLALDAAKMGLWDWDIATNQVIWTVHHETILGYEPGRSERTYQEWADRVHPDDLEQVAGLIQCSLEAKIDYHCEYRLLLPTGEIRWASGSGRGYYDAEGKPVRMVGVLLDITDHKEAELAAQKRNEELDWKNRLLIQTTALLRRRNEELDRFAYVASHDLKAPLRAIANLSEWIEEDLAGQMPEQSQQQMQLMRQRVKRMETLINDLLAYSRAGRVQTQPDIIALEPLLKEIIDSLDPPPKFSVQIKSQMPTLIARRVPLIQVFSNLISNAIKHHDSNTEHRPSGKITISVADQGDRLEFAVSDDGNGIAPKDHDRIFEVFQTASTRINPESSGIGLAIVKKIVEAEGGTIRLESGLGKGATFYFSWLKQPRTEMD
jgi:PAS domain S-box-containing protein